MCVLPAELEGRVARFERGARVVVGRWEGGRCVHWGGGSAHGRWCMRCQMRIGYLTGCGQRWEKTGAVWAVEKGVVATGAHEY